MLAELHLEGVEIFADTRVSFGQGLNVIAGETGSGKSVLLACLLATLGDDPPRDLIREGFLETIWQGSPPSALGHLLDEDLWSLSRQIRDGRASSLAGGRSVAASLLQDAAEEIVLRSGQHAAQDLRQKNFHLQTLDNYAETDRDSLSQAWRSWQDSLRSLREQEEWVEREREREDFLRHEVELLQELGPRQGETEELESERNQLLHTEERRQSLREALEGLRGEEGLSETLHALQKISEFDLAANAIAENLDGHLDAIREIGAEIRQLESLVEGEPGRLEEIEKRLLDIKSASRRFKGASEEDLCRLLEQKEKELGMLEDTGSIEDMRQETLRLEEDFLRRAKSISRQRKKSAAKLQAGVNRELQDLDVQPDFVIKITDSRSSASGIDEVEFLLQRGSREAPLVSAASGGEISRVALALLLAGGTEARTYIFDEIDTGIGGETAHLVAEKLHQLSCQSQVLVISHLPQIALRADHLLALHRSSQQTTISPADTQEARRRELARLAGARGEEWGASLEEMLREASGS